MRYEAGTLPKMGLATLTLRKDQQFGLVCEFCRDYAVGFDLDAGDAIEAVAMLVDHYLQNHPGLIEETL